jgi:hypothetical protein
MGDRTAVAFQHDARMHSDNRISFFNNATNSTDSGEVSRGLIVDLDMENMTATLSQEFAHPSGIVSVSQGNNQMQPNGNVFVGWGSAPVFSEFSSDGELIFNGRFPKGVTSYRAHRLPWVGHPSEAPAVAAQKGDGTDVTVYASWNGATEVASWEVLAGDDPDHLVSVGSRDRSGFETKISIKTDAAYVAAQGKDKSGKVLGVSEAVQAKA